MGNGEFVVAQVKENTNNLFRNVLVQTRQQFIGDFLCTTSVSNEFPSGLVAVSKTPRHFSTRYCGPSRFQFFKVLSQVSKEEGTYSQEKKCNMTTTTFNFNNRNYRIQHSLQLTMVEGTVCTALSISASCIIFVEIFPKRCTNRVCLQK